LLSLERDGRARSSIPEVDFVIAGTHTFPKTNIGWFEKINFSEKEKSRIYKEWFIWMKNIVKRNEVDILAHPGMLISQNNIIKKFDTNVVDDFGELFTLAKENGVNIELNERSFHKLNEEQRETYHYLIKLAIDIGLKISIGSDAHSLENIGKKKWCNEIAQKINLNMEICSFRKQKYETKI